MDLYHKVLVKVYEVSGGKESQIVDFRDLVKKMQFHGNYEDIFGFLNTEGWIAQDKQANFVRITHWGIAEVKKTLQSQPSSATAEASAAAASNEAIAQCLTFARELTALLEEQTAKPTTANRDKIKAKFTQLETAHKAAF